MIVDLSQSVGTLRCQTAPIRTWYLNVHRTWNLLQSRGNPDCNQDKVAVDSISDTFRKSLFCYSTIAHYECDQGSATQSNSFLV
ncbi:hypothetical protein HOLleu_22808 [Holothuria leucospilota]|uniref:Uncharacterized protein n=1 Tax=Holothuria leucospilota TaxID=206669 RepID=A0A9Q1BT92_HOLLE|nr:hypothetical protein HOLleu_22808 [Holothuria leucospilota]